jgi:hypothetical protein
MNDLTEAVSDGCYRADYSDAVPRRCGHTAVEFWLTSDKQFRGYCATYVIGRFRPTGA